MPHMRKILYLAMTIVSGLFSFNQASGQINRGAPAVGATELASPTEVSVALEILEKFSVRARLIFKPKGELKDPVMSITGFDIALEHREVGDIAKDLRRSGISALALVVDANNPQEVWFGKIVEPGQRSAELTLDLPGFVKPREATKNYSIQFLAVAGNPKLISGASRSVSVAKLSEVTLKLPEGWQLNDSNWRLISPSENRYGYKGSLGGGEVIQAVLVRPPLAAAEWLQEHIGSFFTVFLVMVVLSVGSFKLLINRGFRQIIAKLPALGIAVLLIAFIWYDYREGGSQGWFERDWWLISSIAAVVVAFVLPVDLISFFLDELKPHEPSVGDHA